jgi:glycogen synthase
MKIGLVCPYNITKGGGVQEVVQALQEGLSDLGHEALIITPRPRDIQKSIKICLEVFARLYCSKRSSRRVFT